MNNIVVTGGSGRFGVNLKRLNYKYKFPNKRELNILSISSIERYLKKHKI